MKISRAFLSVAVVLFLTAIFTMGLSVGNVSARRGDSYSGPRVYWIGGANGNFNQASNWERSALGDGTDLVNEVPQTSDMLVFEEPLADTIINFDLGSSFMASYIHFDCSSSGAEFSYTVSANSGSIAADGDITNYNCKNVNLNMDLEGGGGQLNGPMTIKRLTGYTEAGYYIGGRVTIEEIDASFDGTLLLGTTIASGSAKLDIKKINGDPQGLITIYPSTSINLGCNSDTTNVPMPIRAAGLGSGDETYAISTYDSRTNKNGQCKLNIKDLTLFADTTIQTKNYVDINVQNLNLAGYKLVVDGVNMAKVRAVIEGDHSTENTTVQNYELELKSNSKMGNITIEDQGILKGIGQAKVVVINSGGKLAPGLSPGIITMTDLTLNSGSSYDVELGGTTPGNNDNNHDQTIVTGSTTLNNATLNVILWNGFVPSAGDSFKIIDGAGTINGTFSGLPDGATFTQDGITYRINYVDGDVILTVTSIPSAPNTGFSIIKANPLLPLISGLMVAIGLGLFSFRLRKNIRK